MRVRFFAALLIVLSSVGSAQVFYKWRQSAWGGGANAMQVSTSSNGNSNYYSSDGNLFFTGTDSDQSGAVILRPTGVISPRFSTWGEYSAAGFGQGNTAGMLLGSCGGSNAYDFNDSVDGNGSYRAGLFPSGLEFYTSYPNFAWTYAAFHYKYYNPYLYDGYHPTITTNTNIFLLFFLKYDGYVHQNSPFINYGADIVNSNSMLGLCFFIREPNTGDVFVVSNMYRLCPGSNRWVMNYGQFRIWYDRFVNESGILSASAAITTGLVAYFGVKGTTNISPMSPTNPSGQFMGQTYWVDQMIAAHSFATNGYFLSSPIAVPRYQYGGGLVHPYVNLNGIGIGGIQGVIGNFPATKNGIMANTNINAVQYFSDCSAQLQIRSGRTLTELFTNSWYGSGGVGTYFATSMTNSEWQTNNTSMLPAAVQNGLYFQYRMMVSSMTQGSSPILTNVTLFFRYNGGVDTSFADPGVISYSGTNLSAKTFILYMSNYYDPINTKVYAFNATRREAEVAVDSVNDHLQPYTTPKYVFLSTTTLAGDKYSLKISNNNNPNVVILTDVLDLGSTPTGAAAIDTSTVRRGYVPVNNRVDIQFSLNIVGTRTVFFEIYDSVGQLVHRIQSNNMTTGAMTVAWVPNGGRKISTGIYVYNIKLMSESGSVDSKKGMIYIVK